MCPQRSAGHSRRAGNQPLQGSAAGAITQQTIKRQQQIMTRLLEHEKAEMQREKEERRESHEGKEMPHTPSQSDLEQLRRLQENNMEIFRSTPPTLSPYYKSKVDNYFYQF